MAVPVIDIAQLIAGGEAAPVAAQIRTACMESGFFYITGHGVPAALIERLEALSHEFFALPVEEKMRIRMELGGRAWRGYFPVEGELTSGRPDLKEGLYLGTELADDHPAVVAGTPLHGRNLFPERPAGLKQAILDYIAAVTAVGHHVMRGIALSLGLAEGFFAEHYTGDPLVLFRIFSYPNDPTWTGKAADGSVEERWGVGEHTDYGLLTLLYQDACGGLQVKTTRSGWIDAPPVPGSFVCNIGDMLDRMTKGLYKSTPHRVRNTAGRTRLSFPLFFDPSMSAAVSAIEGLVGGAAVPSAGAAGAATSAGGDGAAATAPAAGGAAASLDALVAADKAQRWDGASVHAPLSGTYGDYLLAKVGKVFPDMAKKAL